MSVSKDGEAGELLESSVERLGFDPTTITRPEPRLLTYYAVSAAFGLIFFPLLFIPAWIRYRSLRYRIDDEGVSMSWGVLNRREVFLTYRRLQDIQMTRGIIQRKLGLADLHLHTASGGSGPEMKLEGLPEPEAFRDYLYARMRGAEDGTGTRTSEGATPFQAATSSHPAGTAWDTEPVSGEHDEGLDLLRQIRDEIRRMNQGKRG